MGRIAGGDSGAEVSSQFFFLCGASIHGLQPKVTTVFDLSNNAETEVQQKQSPSF
jgi:hypothetical protein